MWQKLGKSTFVNPKSLPSNSEKISGSLYVEFEEKTNINGTLNFGAHNFSMEIK